ncbi:helix-turn-helix transcriptional regulator [Bradyrhizobium prioriisuperbiae]|uniref:helix-turn-helix transcriptional regulator n=1 Tax=Bradyrhizobium prioriisuperbiae TaxID=2854389 RepID=UPI0028EC0BEA|nr:helix-turn-helix domain-containing protein [Bradyrhizobium prioritasuperba]
MKHERRDSNRDFDHGSGHLMLISPERVFYAGLLGRPRGRTTGSLMIYVSIEGRLKLTQNGRCDEGLTIATVRPNVPHTIESEFRSVINVTIEPETVTPAALEQLIQRVSDDGPTLVERIRGAYHQWRLEKRRGGFTTQEFDSILLGEVLPRRPLDARIVAAIARLNVFSGPAVTAADCADAINLSQSRFLHLFKQETGISFRAYRAHKRARHLLHFVNDDINLAHLAQDIGYPDSTHFCHSIRRFYGLKPRAIFSGSRDLRIYRSDASDGAQLVTA